MPLLVWLILAGVAGAAAILGSLMTLASLLLCWVPSRKIIAPNPSSVMVDTWKSRLKLILFSVSLAIAGFSTFSLIPFSSY